MKKQLSLILTSLALAFSVGVISYSKKAESNIGEADAAQHAANFADYSYSGNYYSSITSDKTEGLDGTLRSSLTTLIHPTSVPDYSSGLATHLQQADEDPTNSSNMVYLYTRDSVTKNSASSWNREHVWPKALSNSCWQTSRAGADMLHLRPTYETPNSTRSSIKYGNVEETNSNKKVFNNLFYAYSNGSYFMPLEATRGDVARICMYIWVAYYNEYGSKLPALTKVFESFDVMMQWHISDKPDVLEGHRNDYAQANVQYNRNPFVDHPEYAWKIFGDSCSASVKAAAQAAYPDTPTVGITSISKTSASLIKNNSTTISATSSNSGTISWSSDNTSVATVSSGSAGSGSEITINAVGAGTANITASITISGTTYSKSCAVSVAASKQAVSLAVSGQKTKFTVGDTFSFGGSAIATYNDDTEETVTNSLTFTGYDMSTAGTQTVTVKYTYGVEVSTTYEIKVSASGGGSTDYELYSGSITEGNYLIVYDNKAMKNTVSSDRLSYTKVSPSNDVISNPDASLIWHIEQSGSYWTIYNENVEKYAASTGVKNKAQLLASGTDDKSLWSVSGTSTYEFVNKNNSSNGVNANLRENGTVGYACYATNIGGALSLYKQTSSTPVTLSSIEVSTAPTKTTYTAGEYFNPTGLVISRTYSDSTSDTYTYASHTSEFTFTPNTSTALTTGNTSVTITYGGKSCSQAITVNAAKTLSSIAVSTAPTKTTYTAGEYFDPTGLVITRNYSDSTSDTYTYSGHTSEFTFTPSTSTALTTSNVSVNITYGGKSTSQVITVNAAKTLSSISVSTAPTKTTYDAGDNFDPTGLVITRNYSDSTSDTYTYAGHISEFSFNPTTSSKLKSTDVSVTITYGGKSTSQAITVNPATLSSISVSTAPTKLTYTVGEYFDPTGLVITRTYSDETSDTYTYANHTSEFSFTPSTSTALTTQHTSVTITFSGKSTSQAITVNSSGGGSSETGWVETSITELTSSDVFVIVGNNGSNYAMPNNATSSAPSAVSVTVSEGKITSEVADTLKWNVSVSNSQYTFYPNGSTSTWLFCTDTNNGVRVGTTSSNQFILDSTGYLKSATLTRYIGIYNSQDWRCYSGTGGNISGQTFAFYKYSSGSTPEPGTPSLTWTEPTIDVFSGTTLSANSYTSWGVTYNDGNGNTTNPSLNDVAVKLGSATITLPYTWSSDDNGKSLLVEYNSKSTSSTTVTVTQTINNVMADMSSVSTKTWTVASGDLGTTIASVNGTASGTLTFDDSSTMSYIRTLQYVASGKSDHIGMNGTYMQFGSSNALEKLELTATTSGTVTSVVVDCWAKDGASNVSVTVGGNAFDSSKSCPSSGADVTFSGSASGTVVITMEKSSKTSGLAQYIKSVSITAEGSSGSTTNIANSESHKAAQRVAVKFAKAFNAAMDSTGYCTANMSTAWSTCSAAYTTFKTEAAALGSTEEAYAKNLIKYATVQWSNDSGEACIERMMKTYEVCVTKHGQKAFMSDLFTVNTSLVNTISIIQENALPTTLVIIVSAIGIFSIAGYFFIKKRKEI